MYRVTLFLCALAIVSFTTVTVVAQDERNEGDSSTSEGASSKMGDGSSEKMSDTDGRYDELTTQATEAFNNGDFQTSIDLFQQAYALKPSSNLLYNIARTYEEVGDLEQALNYYQQFIKAPNVSLDNRKAALDRIKVIEEVLGTNEENTENANNNNPTPDPNPQPQVRDQSSGLTTAGIVAVAIGGAALIGGGVFTLLAISSHDDFENAQTLGDRRSAADDTETNSLAGDILVISGALITTTGVLMVVLDDGGSEAPGAGARIAPLVGPETVGASYQLAW